MSLEAIADGVRGIGIVLLSGGYTRHNDVITSMKSELCAHLASSVLPLLSDYRRNGEKYYYKCD